ncbi:MAG: hypothetical protein K9H64_08435 [Bacteroidales bacterium]|nr:hypothetical protein [Bacteroidales bacterium]MCF8455859.1 hypothetical protein [Bacteroidales bacterium]
MTVQLYIPGNPGSIIYYGPMPVPPQPVNGGDVINFYGLPFNYDIYGVRIYDNSGGSNDATVGDTYGFSDDFDYAPPGSTLNYNVNYYPGAYYPVQQVPAVFNSTYILLY